MHTGGKGGGAPGLKQQHLAALATSYTSSNSAVPAMRPRRQVALLEHTVAGLRKKVEDDRRAADAQHRRMVRRPGPRGYFYIQPQSNRGSPGGASPHCLACWAAAPGPFLVRLLQRPAF